MFEISRRAMLAFLMASAVQFTPATLFASEPVSGGTLNVGFKDDAKTLDPIYSTVWSERQVLFLIYDSLLNIDADFSIKPGLAREWSFDDTSTRLTLNLVADVKFHDGTPFNAEAVKWNLERRMDESANSPQRGQLQPFIASIETPDELTVVINLHKPYPALPGLLTDRAGLMVSPTAAQAAPEDFGSKPVGTGPFSFVNWQRGSRVEVKRNENFWQDGLPHLDSVVFQDVSAAVVGIQRMITGELDIMPEISPQNARLLDGNADVELLRVPVGNWFSLQWHWYEAPFDNDALRKAVAHALDRERINQILWAGQGTVASSLTPDGLWWTPEGVPTYEFDREQAKKYLAESGYDTATPLKLSAPSDPLLRQLVQLVMEDLGEIGLTVELEPIAQSEWYPRVFSRQINFTPIRWTQRADPDGLIQMLFHSKGSGNTTGYSNPEVDALIEEAGQMTDPAKRAPIYSKIHEQIFTDLPYVSIAFSGEFVAMNKAVEGFTSMPDLIPRYRDLWKAQ